MLGTFHANVIQSAETWMHNLNEFTCFLLTKKNNTESLARFEQPHLTSVRLKPAHYACCCGSACKSGVSAVIFYASLWVAMTLPSLNEEHQCVAGMMLPSQGIFAGTELLASLHNPQRHTLNLHFNEIFSCH